MAPHDAVSAESEGDSLPLSPKVDPSIPANPLPSDTPSPRRDTDTDTEPFPALEDSHLEDPFYTPSATTPSDTNPSDAPQAPVFFGPPRLVGPSVNNYPAANKILMGRFGGPPRGNPARIQQLHNLMHGTVGGAPVIGSDGQYHDPNTSAHLDYGIEDISIIREGQYAVGGAPVAQPPSHPQAALGRFMELQEELKDITPDSHPLERPYGFHADNRPPFINLVADVFPNTYPVMRIENIPFGVSYAEIVLHMEKHLMPHLDGANRNYPIHILMERSTGKSQDAWLELPDQHIMDACMSRYESLCSAGKQPKMGGRVVDCFASTQGELMAALFPHAKDIYWHPSTGIPILVKPDFSEEGGDDPYSQGFRGFLTKEELYCTKTHAENPGRAPFPQKSLQRCYESMIATIIKYPWASPYFKMSERDELFNTYEAMLATLAKKVHDNDYIAVHGRHVGLTDRLCTNFINIGLRCPGFSERQKARIAYMMDMYNVNIPLSDFSRVWPFNILAIPAEIIDEDLVRWMELFDLGCTITEQYNNSLATSVTGIVELSRDRNKIWLMQDIALRAEQQGVPGAVEYGFADMAAAEELLMKALVQRGWEQFFHIRNMAIPDGVVPFETKPTTIQKKMESLGVFEDEGIDRPKARKPGHDIVHVLAEQRGAWRHLLRSSTTEIPVKSMTEALAQVGLVADPRDEIEFQRIQAEIRGETDAPHSGSSSAGPSGSGDELQYSGNAQVVVADDAGRPGYGMMHAQATPNFHTRRYSTVSNTPRETAFQATPSATIRSNYASGTFSAPQRSTIRITSPDDGQEVNFDQIAQQVIATKSVENTPQGKILAADADPFAPSGSRGAVDFYDRVGRASDGSPSVNRRRSQSPNKSSYTVTTTNRTWENAPRFGNFGAVGTPPRRAPMPNTVNAAPTIPEGDEDETWPTPSASVKGKGRASRG